MSKDWVPNTTHIYNKLVTLLGLQNKNEYIMPYNITH